VVDEEEGFAAGVIDEEEEALEEGTAERFDISAAEVVVEEGAISDSVGVTPPPPLMAEATASGEAIEKVGVAPPSSVSVVVSFDPA